MSATESGRLKRALGRVIEELEDEEVREDFEALKNRKLTLGDLLEAIREAPPEERAALREILAEEGLPTSGAGGNGSPAPTPPAPPAPPPETEPPAAATTRRKRPGRKSGAAYDWYVDEETGDVVRSPVAIVYSGEDEPDEVEMLDLPAVSDEGEGREGE